ELLVPIFRHGELVYKEPSLPEIQQYCKAQTETLWEEVKRFENPHVYNVDLSRKLWDLKKKMLDTEGCKL
ncbi:MAG TPA: nicotinate phosphoribosyltransferase, partial [Acidaminococcaceae bacterium]|nr:nicotinate phosphoribosyltransferase [Acidaminococcaceae bacterium]